MTPKNTTASGQAGLTDAHFLATLDGWRAIAIGGVIICHVATLYSETSLLVHLGAHGVALFFAISGFLITTRLLIERDGAGRISLPAFYIRRACRILPPVFLYLGTLAVLGRAQIVALRPHELWSALLFFNNYWPDRSWFTVHFWSLSVEEHFYLLWPAVLSLLGPRRIRWFAVAVIVATVAWRPVGFHLMPGVSAIERTDMRLDAFMFACLLAILMHDRETGGFVRYALAKTWVPAAIVLGLGLSYAFSILFSARLVKEFAQAALMPLLIGATVLASKSALGRFLELAPMRYIGRISFGLYLWQELFLTNVLHCSVVVKLILLFSVAVITYEFYDRKWMAFGRKASKPFLRKKTPPIPVGALQPASEG
jgi:peptidoglycan/LPS O-acetylase OafA/YrhL